MSTHPILVRLPFTTLIENLDLEQTEHSLIKLGIRNDGVGCLYCRPRSLLYVTFYISDSNLSKTRPKTKMMNNRLHYTMLDELKRLGDKRVDI